MCECIYHKCNFRRNRRVLFCVRNTDGWRKGLIALCKQCELFCQGERMHEWQWDYWCRYYEWRGDKYPYEGGSLSAVIINGEACPCSIRACECSFIHGEQFYCGKDIERQFRQTVCIYYADQIDILSPLCWHIREMPVCNACINSCMKLPIRQISLEPIMFSHNTHLYGDDYGTYHV